MPFRAENVVHTRVPRAELTRLLRQIPDAVTGRGDRTLAQQLMVRVGLAILGRIKQAFVVKSRGGTDESGLRWAPIKPSTIAYSRRHKGKKKTTDSSRPSSALSSKQRDRWWEVYSRNLARYKGNKGRAAAIAWLTLKDEGAKTIIGQFGGAKVEILRDTGLLLNSLSPGVTPDAAGPTPPQVPNQVFRAQPAAVVIGTNRKGAAAHHKGIPGRLPQRRLWPDPRRWPKGWWDDALAQAQQGILDIVTHLLRR